MKNLWIIGFILSMSLGLASQVNADFFDALGDMVDRVTDRAEQKAEDRMNERLDEAVDSTFESTDEAVDCALTDEKCRQEKEASPAAAVPGVNAGGSSATMKCVITDVACLKEAKSLGKQVEIVDEEDLDVFRCKVTDVACLQKAKQLGKQVEIVD